MITGNHIRSARALCGWEQIDLAARAGIALSSVVRLEKDFSLSTKAGQKIIKAFEREDIEISEDGIRIRKKIIHVSDDFMDVLEDAQASLKEGDELLHHCASEERNTPEITLKFAEMVNSGIQHRFTICEGDICMTTDANNYRWIDREYFSASQVIVIYKDKVVFHVLDGQRDIFVMIVNNDLASIMRSQFNYFWKKGKKPCQE